MTKVVNSQEGRPGDYATITSLMLSYPTPDLLWYIRKGGLSGHAGMWLKTTAPWQVLPISNR